MKKLKKSAKVYYPQRDLIPSPASSKIVERALLCSPLRRLVDRRNDLSLISTFLLIFSKLEGLLGPKRRPMHGNDLHIRNQRKKLSRIGYMRFQKRRST